MADAPRPNVTKGQLIDEIRTILKLLLEQAAKGNRPRLSDAGALFVNNRLNLDFVEYFKFLRRFNYVAIDRTDQGLAVTEEGKGIAERGPSAMLEKDVLQHFAKLFEEPKESVIVAPMERVEEPPAIPASQAAPPGPPPTLSEGSIRSGVMKIGPESRKEGIPFPGGKGADSRYTRYDPIGSGGIGTVYKGRHNALGLDLAIKEIKDVFTFFSFLQRSEVIRHFKEVVGQMAMLNHPLAVKILDQNVEVAHPFFIMEHLPGGNLRELLTKGPQPLDLSLIIFTQICYALHAAHQAAFVHGDIKPENILFDVQGNVRVTDFGITRLLQTDTDRQVPQVVTGSIGYMSPEQMRPKPETTPGSDIYSLGILLYELLTGSLPGRRSPPPSATNQEIPKALDSLFDRMTRDKPEERYPNLEAVLLEFYSIFKDGRYLANGRMVLFSSSPFAK